MPSAAKLPRSIILGFANAVEQSLFLIAPCELNAGLDRFNCKYFFLRNVKVKPVLFGSVLSYIAIT